MNPRELLPLTDGNLGRAITLEQLMYYEQLRSEKTGEDRPWFTVSLAHISKYTETTRMSVSRYLKWLSERKFILIRYVKVGRYQTLQIRLLLRSKLRGVTLVLRGVTKTLSNSIKLILNSSGEVPSQKVLGRLKQGSPEKEGPSPQPPFQNQNTDMALRGKVEDASDRAKATQAKARSSGKITPTVAAHLWNKLLRQSGDDQFAVDGKNLSHVAKTLIYLKPDSIDDLTSSLQTAIEWWHSHHHQYEKLKDLPAHPWVINRNPDRAFTPIDPTPPPETAPSPAPAPAPTPDPTPTSDESDMSPIMRKLWKRRQAKLARDGSKDTSEGDKTF